MRWFLQSASAAHCRPHGFPWVTVHWLRVVALWVRLVAIPLNTNSMAWLSGQLTLVAVHGMIGVVGGSAPPTDLHGFCVHDMGLFHAAHRQCSRKFGTHPFVFHTCLTDVDIERALLHHTPVSLVFEGIQIDIIVATLR